MDTSPGTSAPEGMPIRLPVAYSQGFAQIRFTSGQAEIIPFPAPAEGTACATSKALREVK